VSKAKAFKSGWVASGTASATYTIDLGEATPPTMDPPGGRYATEQTVTLTSATFRRDRLLHHGRLGARRYRLLGRLGIHGARRREYDPQGSGLRERTSVRWRGGREWTMVYTE